MPSSASRQQVSKIRRQESFGKMFGANPAANRRQTLGMRDNQLQDRQLPWIGCRLRFRIGLIRRLIGRLGRDRRSRLCGPPPQGRQPAAQIQFIDAELARDALYDLLLLNPRVAAGFAA